jgi:hypothetical protein
MAQATSQRPTIRQIAEQAGVFDRNGLSRRVLNGRAILYFDVSVET